jgi:hypothetical protein
MKENTSNRDLHSAFFFTYRYIKFLVICCLLALASCKARKQLVTNRTTDNVAKPSDNKLNQLDAIRAAQIHFNTFSGRARTKLDFSGNINDVTLNIRIKKDQKIWVSITAIAGIEVARALITPDSILIINRLQSVYIKQPFSYINKFAGKEVNYITLESLLTGNAIPELINKNADLQTKRDTITLTGNLQDVMYKLIVGPGMKVTQTNLNNQIAGQSLQVNNNTFVQTDNITMPSQIDIASVVKDKKIQVNLHYIKLEFDKPLEYPFNVPANYSETN